MLDHFARRRLVLFEHILDQINPAARGIELVPEQDIGRARRRAESAVNASAQDLLGGSELRILQLCEGERGLHRQTPAHMRPGLSTPFGSKLSFTRLVKAPMAGSSGANTSTLARTAAGARTNVACPPTAATARRIAGASGSFSSGIATQIRPPAQS